LIKCVDDVSSAVIDLGSYEFRSGKHSTVLIPV
jgi:hypothetical protein